MLSQLVNRRKLPLTQQARVDRQINLGRIDFVHGRHHNRLWPLFFLPLVLLGILLVNHRSPLFDVDARLFAGNRSETHDRLFGPRLLGPIGGGNVRCRAAHVGQFRSAVQADDRRRFRWGHFGNVRIESRKLIFQAVCEAMG